MDERPTQTVRAWQAVGFVWDLLASIAVPTILLALLGRWLDNRWHTTPWLTVVGLVVAIVIAGLMVYRLAERGKNLLK